MLLSRHDKLGTSSGVQRPLKISEVKKNVKKSVWFRKTFDFERKHLWNGWRYRQAANGVNEHDHSGVEQRQICEFRFINQKEALMLTHS